MFSAHTPGAVGHTHTPGAVGSRHCGVPGVVGGSGALLKGLTSVRGHFLQELRFEPTTLGLQVQRSIHLATTATATKFGFNMKVLIIFLKMNE